MIGDLNDDGVAIIMASMTRPGSIYLHYHLWPLWGGQKFTPGGGAGARAEGDPLEYWPRISDDGQHLITSLDDITHQIWQLDNSLDNLLARGCALLANHFRANPSLRQDKGICLDQAL